MDKSSIKPSAKEKELKRFHSEMKFLDQRYQSEKDNLEKRKMRDTGSLPVCPVPTFFAALEMSPISLSANPTVIA